MNLRFTREEFAGSLGNLGTIVPLACAMVFINRLDPVAVFGVMGAFYLLSGLYFRVPVPVEPMKVIAAYAIANSISYQRVAAAALFLGVLLILLGGSGTITLLARLVPKSCVRGVQLTTGVLLFIQGVNFMLGKTAFQASQGKAEPFLSIQTVGPVPIGVILGVITVLLIFLLLDNKKVPAALAVIVAGTTAGVALGGWRGLQEIGFGLYLPRFISPGTLTLDDLVIAVTTLALPQLPMTVCNAIMAQADLTHEYFGEKAAMRSTPRAHSISMGLANIAAGLFGGMPLCHGAGGLAAHYRFGARTAMSNFIIGAVFLAAAFFIGDGIISLFSLIPLSVLGALLCFAGAQLAMTIIDINDKKDLFVALATLCVSLSTNLAWGFGCAIALAYLFKHTRVTI